MSLNPTTFFGVDMVENFDTLIWTERFRSPGEFTLVTTDVANKKQELPEGTLVAITSSDEVMMVETHSSKFTDSGAEELTIKGRSLDFFFENRVQWGEVNENWPFQQEYAVQGAAAVLMWNHIANTGPPEDSVLDVTKGVDYLSDSLWGNSIDPRSFIPNVAITYAVDASEAVYIRPVNEDTGETESPVNVLAVPRKWYLHGGPVYPQLMDFLNIGNLGIRCKRPPTSSGQMISVAANGNITLVSAGNPAGNKLRFEIYNGTYRGINSGDGVTFRQDAKTIKDASYLFSIKDLKTAAIVNVNGEYPRYVYEMTQTALVNNELVLASESSGPYPNEYLTGLNHRLLYVDGGDLPADIDNPITYQNQLGLAELKKHNRVVLLEGSIPTNSRYVYGRDYFLGDTVAMIGRYGVKQDMIVEEYERTHDAEGDRGFPTLALRQDLVLP
jgi:hypothetical protein